MSEVKMESGALREITSADFIREVMASKEPAVVEFWTPWSRACQILDAVVQKLATEYAGITRVVRVNADECLDLGLVYDIQSVPTLLCFVEGNPRWQIVGIATLDAIQSKLKPLFE